MINWGQERIDIFYDRLCYNTIINSINAEFQNLLNDNNHNLDYIQIDEFICKYSDYIEDIEFDFDDKNNIVYTLKFKDYR